MRNRIHHPGVLAPAALALATGLVTAGAMSPGFVQGAAATEVELHVAIHANLKNIDPIWTTALITSNHGYAIYDTLFGTDADFKPQPQMAEGYTVSADGRVYTITLRDGLAWHDGSPVTAADCVASINRWGQRDALGQVLMSKTETLEARTTAPSCSPSGSPGR